MLVAEEKREILYRKGNEAVFCSVRDMRDNNGGGSVYGFHYNRTVMAND